MQTTSDTYGATSLLQFFGFEGRVRRVTFWVTALFYGVANFVLSQMFTEVRFSFVDGEQYYISNKPVYYLLTALVLARFLSVAARRWQDLDKSGFLAIAFFFPALASLVPNFVFYTSLGNVLAIVGSIILLIAAGFLGFVPGDDGENTFGPPPEEGQWF